MSTLLALVKSITLYREWSAIWNTAVVCRLGTDPLKSVRLTWSVVLTLYRFILEDEQGDMEERMMKDGNVYESPSRMFVCD